jgi:hypothetical protein
MMHKKTKKHHRHFLKNNKYNKSLKNRKILIGGSINDVEREGIIDKINNKIGLTIKNVGTKFVDKFANMAGYQRVDSPNFQNSNTLIDESSKTFQNLTNVATNTATNVASNAIESVNEVLAAPQVQETIAEAAENTKEVAEDILEKINKPFEDPMFKNELQEAANNVAVGAEIILKAADKPIDMAIDKAAESLTKMGEAAATSSIKIGTDILATLPPPIGTVVDIARMVNDSTRAASSMVEAGSEVVETGSDLVVETLNNIEDEVKKVGELKEKMKEKTNIENRLNNSIENFKNPIPQYGGKKFTRKRLFKRGKMNKVNKYKSKRVRFAV